MPAFSIRSENRLNTCCSHLQRIARVTVVRFDCTVVWGRRGKEAQDEAFENGWTTKRWPSSIHNMQAPAKSKALDLLPWPLNWEDEPRLYYFSGYVRGKAEELGIKLRHGADWDGDFDINDQILRDPCHFECAEVLCQEVDNGQVAGRKESAEGTDPE